VAVLLAALPAPAQYPTGLEALQQVENWPLYRQGAVLRQLSSSDPLGGDADGTAYLYQQDSLFVIFDQAGPGCVYRLWVRHTPQTANRVIKIYFDNEVFPSLSVPVGTLFSGFYQNFLSPLAGGAAVSAGGYYSYLPLPFNQRLKIAFVGGVLPHQVAWHQYPSGTVLASFSSQNPAAVTAQWLNPGTDPKPTAGNLTETGLLTLGPGQTQTLFSRAGSGSVTGIILTLNPASLNVLESVRLKGWWDGAAAPQVDCALGSFFANALGPGTVGGLPLGRMGNQYYCYFPMPYWSQARLELQNPLMTLNVSVGYEITYKTTTYPEAGGWFTARQTPYQSAVLGQDMILGDLAGHGQAAGMALTLISSAVPAFAHGDLRFYADGLAQPLAQGTDTDGDFNAGNYFNASPFALPMHGVPAILVTETRKVNAYRFFLGDLVPFGSHVTLRSEHGDRNSAPLQYSSVLYAYWRPDLALVQSDVLDVGDTASEQAHGYAVLGGQAFKSHYYAYPGTLDGQFFTDQGREHFGTSTFTVTLDPLNEGIRLVRRRDASLFPQQAVVSVDGDSVGLWSDPDYNYHRRWAESVFEIPAQFTGGLSQVQISVARQGTVPWSEYQYRVYSHVPPRPDTQPPGPLTNLEALPLEDGSKLHLTWDPADDDAGVAGYRVYRSAVPGFSPGSANQAGWTVLPFFTDQGLEPGTWYYYRLRAEDFAGNLGPLSEQIAIRSGNSYLVEAENMTVAGTSPGDTAQVVNMLEYGDAWSNQHQRLLTANGLNDYVYLNLAVSRTDSYDVAGYFTKGPDYGIVRLEIDDRVLGQPYDLYATQVTRSPWVEFGAAWLTAGMHRLALEVAGKNLASSNYRLGADDFLLTSHLLAPVPPQDPPVQPGAFALEQNFPNPFNASTRVRFILPRSGWTRMEIFDPAGRRVAVVRDGWMAAGSHDLTWDAGNLGSGIYFLALRHGNDTLVRKLLLLK